MSHEIQHSFCDGASSKKREGELHHTSSVFGTNGCGIINGDDYPRSVDYGEHGLDLMMEYGDIKEDISSEAKPSEKSSALVGTAYESAYSAQSEGPAGQYPLPHSSQPPRRQAPHQHEHPTPFKHLASNSVSHYSREGRSRGRRLAHRPEPYPLHFEQKAGQSEMPEPPNWTFLDDRWEYRVVWARWHHCWRHIHGIQGDDKMSNELGSGRAGRF
jgi:hypothetical protein